MCIHCTLKQRHEAMDWMRDKLKNVPDVHVITFARIIEENLTVSIRGPSISNTREDAIEVMAGYFWAAKQSKQRLMEMLESTFGEIAEQAERHGYAA